jgi:uncharacterized membrane protein YqjE
VSLLHALPRIAPLLVRHVIGYADLAGEELDGIALRLRRRAIAAATCALAAFISVLLGCVLVIALAWETPYRYWVIAGLAVAFCGTALIAGATVRRERREGGRLFGRLREEWSQDRQALQQIMASRNEDAREDWR